MESRATEERSLVEARSSVEWMDEWSIESPFKEMVCLCCRPPLTLDAVSAADTMRFVGLRGMGELFLPLLGCSRFDLTVPASLRWNQCSSGLLDRWLFTFFGDVVEFVGEACGSFLLGSPFGAAVSNLGFMVAAWAVGDMVREKLKETGGGGGR